MASSIEFKVPEKDIKEFRRLLGYAEREMRDGLMASLADTARSLVMQGFYKQREPDGTPWKGLSTRDSVRILHPTQKQRQMNSMRPTSHTPMIKRFALVHTSQTGFVIKNEAPYFDAMQHGFITASGRRIVFRAFGAVKSTKNGVVNPPRRMLPDAGGGFPRSWSSAFEKKADRYVSSMFGRKKKVSDRYGHTAFSSDVKRDIRGILFGAVGSATGDFGFVDDVPF